MAKFTLQNPERNIPYSKITQGRKWVGRVYPKSDGTFGAVLNGINEHVTAPTRVAAFELVVSRYLGFNNVDELKANNSRVRATNRINRQIAQSAVNEYLNATSADERFAALNKVLGL